MNNLFKNKHACSSGNDEISVSELQKNELTGIDAHLSKLSQEVSVPLDFRTHLQAQLYSEPQQNAVNEKKTAPFRASRIGWLAVGLALVALVFTFLLPALKRDDKIAKEPTNDVTEVAENPTEVVPSESPEPTDEGPLEKFLITLFGDIVQAQTGELGVFGDGELTLTTAFPDAPTEAVVYEQAVEEVTSPEQAKAFAGQLGIHGEVYQTPYEGGGYNYVVSDGIQQVTIINTTTYFVYTADFGSGVTSSIEPLPLAERASIAETFLKDHGMLDFDYRVNETLSRDNRVIFTRILDDLPLLENNAYSPFIEVRLDSAGKITWLIYSLNKINPIGNYPLRSAQEAWNIVLEDPNDKRVQYNIISPEQSYRTAMPAWQRTYPMDQRVDLYSYLTRYESADANGEDWVTADGFTLEGDLAGLISAYESPPDLTAEQQEMISAGIVSQKHAYGWTRFFHIWGQPRQDENGARHLTVEGWEVSPMPDETIFGEFRGSTQQAVFIDEDNQQWDIPDLPDGIPQDVYMMVRGVRVIDQPNHFIWSILQVEPVETISPQGSGGGGGGSMEFSPEAGATPEPTPEPVPLPYEVGEQIDDLVGTLTMRRIVKNDGTKVTLAYLGAYHPDDPQIYIGYQLLDEDLTPLESLIMLHLRVSGTFTVMEDGSPAIQLQNVEKAYPDEEVQAWLGTQQLIELGGRPVMQFTDSISGEQYILSRSLTMPVEFLTDGFNGGQFIIEGVLSQDTYEGLPMITEFAGTIAVGVTDLDDYVIYTNQIFDEPEMPTTFSEQVTNNINIDSVELAYFYYDLTQGGGGLPISESPIRFRPTGLAVQRHPQRRTSGKNRGPGSHG